ncbi:type III secretion system protein SctP [Trinickia sp. LjRoot230]|uniref:type III secretion system protein SctP n=1 Tax=Trinickia sp. LjRoot230 TaxID=3342288 RepID=UPI003ED02A20
MARIDNSPVRILASGDQDQDRRARTRSTSVDYAALIRRGRSRDRITFGREGSHDGTEQRPSISHRSTREQGESDDEHRSADATYTADERELVDRLPSMVHGLLKAIVSRAIGGDRIVAEIAHTIERFCMDPAVADAGQWDIELDLDPAVLRNTTLLLHLSPFVVRIRFLVRDPHAKQLISDHVYALKTRLEKAMSANGALRDINIEID